MDNRIRAVCAQIALEHDPDKVNRLIVQLKRLFRGEDVAINLPTEEEPSILSMLAKS
jgi:hypothetical protein